MEHQQPAHVVHSGPRWLTATSAPPPPTCSMLVVPSGCTVSSTISVKPTKSIDGFGRRCCSGASEHRPTAADRWAL